MIDMGGMSEIVVATPTLPPKEVDCWSYTSGVTRDTGPACGHRRKPHETMSAIITSIIVLTNKASITNKTGRSSVIVKWYSSGRRCIKSSIFRPKILIPHVSLSPTTKCIKGPSFCVVSATLSVNRD